MPWANGEGERRKRTHVERAAGSGTPHDAPGKKQLLPEPPDRNGIPRPKWVGTGWKEAYDGEDHAKGVYPLSHAQIKAIAEPEQKPDLFMTIRDGELYVTGNGSKERKCPTRLREGRWAVPKGKADDVT